MNSTWWISLGCFAGAFSLFAVPYGFYLRSENQKTASVEVQGVGGKGGSGSIVNGSGLIVGGRGGAGGVSGKGGDGGSGSIVGGTGTIIGGDGGDAGQVNGQGGKGGMSPSEKMGVPNEKLPDGSMLWDKGRGGNGGGVPIKKDQEKKD